LYLAVGLSSYAVEESNTITISIGATGHVCGTLACNINTFCTSSPVLCITGIPIDSACYSNAVGGTISINIIRPTQIVGIQTCPSSSPQELFTAEITISYVSKYSPTVYSILRGLS